MRTLDCPGVVSVGDDRQTTYKLLYRPPSPGFFTLEAVLSAQRETPTLPLGKKFACAKVLSRAVLWVHLAGWLHKSIRSDDVVFGGDDEAQVDLAEPYLCGFEYSRRWTRSHWPATPATSCTATRTCRDCPRTAAALSGPSSRARTTSMPSAWCC